MKTSQIGSYKIDQNANIIGCSYEDYQKKEVLQFKEIIIKLLKKVKI